MKKKKFSKMCDTFYMKTDLKVIIIYNFRFVCVAYIHVYIFLIVYKRG